MRAQRRCETQIWACWADSASPTLFLDGAEPHWAPLWKHVQAPALVPDRLVEQLRDYGPPGKSIEISIRAVPWAQRTPWQQFRVAFFASLRPRS